MTRPITLPLANAEPRTLLLQERRRSCVAVVALVALVVTALLPCRPLPAAAGTTGAPRGGAVSVSLTGTVRVAAGDHFRLLVAGTLEPVTVMVEAATEWSGSVSGPDDLHRGTRVTVEGTQLAGGAVRASTVSGSSASSGELVFLSGTVSAINGTSFILAMSHSPCCGRTSIHTGADTEWGGSLTSIADLRNGLTVSVEGTTRSDGGIDATRVASDGLPAGEQLVLTGSVQAVGRATFVLSDDGGTAVTVRLRSSTTWGGSLSGVADLQLGAVVTVEGVRLQDGSVAARAVYDEGEPVPAVSLVGTVITVGESGFVLATSGSQGARVSVQVTETTSWQGALAGLYDLLAGQMVAVGGERQQDGSVLAQWVLGHGGPATQLLSLTGSVESVDTTSFTVRPLSKLSELLTVVVGEQTYWGGGLSGITDLRQGQVLYLSGRRVAGTSELTADGVWLSAAGDSGEEAGVHFESRAKITAVVPPDSFTMSDGRSYCTEAGTVYDGRLGRFSGLAAGQFVQVRAVRTRERINRALRIDYHGSEGSGQGYLLINGSVDALDATTITLLDGTVVQHDEDTVWGGDADQWWSVGSGWQVWITAFHDLDDHLQASIVRADAQRQPTTEGQDFAPRQALVLLVEGADADAVAASFAAEAAGVAGEIATLFRWQRELDDALLAAVEADPQVLAVEPNYLFRDPESVRRRYVVVDRQGSEDKLSSQVAGVVVNLPKSAGGALGEGIVVAVLDTGVDPTHPLLAERLLPGGLDLIDDDGEPWEERNLVDDDEDGDIDEAAGHGTFVASVVALVAPGARILPYRILDDDGSGTAFALAVALAHAIDAGVDVVNLSLTYEERSFAVDELLERAADRGIMVVAAAGNDGAASLPFPASDSRVVAVTGVDEDGLLLADFANRSSLVSIAAPSEQVYGAIDDGLWGTWDGTSFAAPFVSGTVAVLLGVDPGLDRYLVLQTLEQTGRTVSDGTWTGSLLDVQLSVTAFDQRTEGTRRPGPTRRH